MAAGKAIIEWQWTPSEPVAAGLVDLARRAALAAPDEPGNWVHLVNLVTLFEGQKAGLEAAAEGLERCPDDSRLRLLAAERLRALGEFERAIEECERALRADPGNRQALLVQIGLKVKTGELETAQSLVGDAAAAEAGDSSIFEYLAARLAEPGAADEMLERCEAVLAKEGPFGQAVYFKALALAKLGQTEAAKETLSLERNVKVSTPPRPPTYADDASFLDAVADEILRQPSLSQDPRGKATAGGRQTETLGDKDGPALAALFALIRSAVQDYAEDLKSSGEALPAHFPLTCSMQSWSVVLGPEGHQRAHRHPDGWLSGVYYVRAPKQEQDGRYSGDLLLGAVEESSGIGPPPWGILHVEPVPGRLVIFPSYVPHATEASRAAGERISVAFDVILTGTGMAANPDAE